MSQKGAAVTNNVSRAQHTDAGLLRRLHVRPIRPQERRRWDALLDRYHYLGLRCLFGKTLRYVAVADERWLALLGWQAAALKCAARDAWIGWPRVLHDQRLHLLANNARFLILPAEHVPNLASRILALNLRRLSADWQVLGHTRGFSRHNARYAAHGQPKQVLLYPLHRGARTLLCAPQLPSPWSTPMQCVSRSTAQMEDLHRRLRELPDCRRPRKQRHRRVGGASDPTAAQAPLQSPHRAFGASCKAPMWAASMPV